MNARAVVSTRSPSAPRGRALLWLGSAAIWLGAALAVQGCGPGIALGVTALDKEKNSKGYQNLPPPADAPSSRDARLAWDPPTHRVNGEPLGADLRGYKIYRGTRSRYYDTVVDQADPLNTQFVFNDLPPGTYYFAVSAYDHNGLESGYSNEATKLIR